VIMVGTLFDKALVEHSNSHAIELRPATFDDDAEMTLTQGLILVSLRRIGIALEDTKRCDRTHLRVLYHLMRHLNHTTGTAFCGRTSIAQELALSEKTIENVLYDLRRWGYIDWQRRAAPDLHPGRLLHYVLPICRYSEDDIAAAIEALRAAVEQKVPAMTGTKTPRLNGDFTAEVPVLTGTRASGESPCPSGYFPARPGTKTPRPSEESPRPGGVSNNNTLCKKERGTRLSPDWQPSQSDRDYARNKGLADWQIDWLAEGFKDYWLSGNAKGDGLKLDWPATWRTRVRDAIEKGQLPKHPPHMNGSAHEPLGRPGR
jgi:hypothetical protein